MGFASLQHMRDRRSTSRGLCLPTTFRPQGLVTLSTAYALRTPAGSVSHRRRSWDSPFGASPSQKVSARFRPNGPTCRFAERFSHCRSNGRPTLPRLLGFDPPESPSRPDACLARRTPDAPLGFALLGFTGEGLVRDFAQTPLARFARPKTRKLQPAHASEYRSASTWPRPPPCARRKRRTRRPF
jgi:hypothetical protein